MEESGKKKKSMFSRFVHKAAPKPSQNVDEDQILSKIENATGRKPRTNSFNGNVDSSYSAPDGRIEPLTREVRSTSMQFAAMDVLREEGLQDTRRSSVPAKARVPVPGFPYAGAPSTAFKQFPVQSPSHGRPRTRSNSADGASALGVPQPSNSAYGQQYSNADNSSSVSALHVQTMRPSSPPMALPGSQSPSQNSKHSPLLSSYPTAHPGSQSPSQNSKQSPSVLSSYPMVHSGSQSPTQKTKHSPLLSSYPTNQRVHSPRAQSPVSSVPFSPPPTPPEKENVMYRPTSPVSQVPIRSVFVYQASFGSDDDDADSSATYSGIGSHFLNSAWKQSMFSDVELRILGKSYRLHRVVLIRSPFFRTMLTNAIDDHGIPLARHRTLEIAIDSSNVNSDGVDAALAFLYGATVDVASDSDDDVIKIHSFNVLSILTAAIYFRIQELVQICLKFITLYDLAPHHHRHLAVETFPSLKNIETPTPIEVLQGYVNFAENHQDTSSAVQLVKDALMKYVCYEGYHHLMDFFISLSPEWLEEILTADAFWCPSEFDRYTFIRDLVQLRGNENDLRLFQTAVTYTHMTFEQLNEVRADGLVPETILMQSLWQQTRFRSMIESAPKTSVSLPSPPKRDSISSSNSQTIAAPCPLRLGVEFSGFTDLKESERRYAHTFFYGGSWWTVFLQRFPVVDKTENQVLEGREKWGVFLRRSEGSALTRAAIAHQGPNAAGDCITCPTTGSKIPRSVSYFYDQRDAVRTVFKVFNPLVLTDAPIFESKVNDYTETQSWGYRSRDTVVTALDLKAENATVRFSIVLQLV